jgi:hypothetical protein
MKTPQNYGNASLAGCIYWSLVSLLRVALMVQGVCGVDAASARANRMSCYDTVPDYGDAGAEPHRPT